MTDARTPTAPMPPAPAPLADARERAIRLLTDRYADDTLSTGEFEMRLDRLYGTLTPAAAEALVADLGTPRVVTAHTAPVPAALPRATAPARAERLSSIFGQRTMAGSWTPGARVEVLAVFSEITFDLRTAVLRDGVELELDAYFSSVRVLLPPDAVLDLNVGPVMGSVTDDTTPARGMGPIVRLRGSAAFAELTIRRASPDLPPGAPFKLAWREAKRAARRACAR